MAHYKCLVYQKELRFPKSVWKLHYNECNLTHKQIRTWGEKVALLIDSNYIRFAYVGESYPGEIFVQEKDEEIVLELIKNKNLQV